MHELSIEEKAIQTYQNNLLFLQETQPKVYEKITALENALEHGHYEEKYELQYKEEGYFDVLEKETKQWLYGKDSNEHAKLAAKSIDFTKKDNLFETFYDVLFTNEEDVASYDDAPIPDSQYSASARIIYYHNLYANKEKTTMKKIYKFIFFGTGLGLHLETIHRKIHANIYLIVEDDLELFRLSLFTCNYKELTDNGAKLFFAIFEDENEFTITAQQFLHEMFIYNHFIKFFHILNHSENKIKEFQKVILGQGYLVFNYSALTTGMLRPLVHIEQGYKILNISKPLFSQEISSKPFLILGAGPSIHHNLEWLKKEQDNFIIVAVSALLSTLEENNIKPSIITHVHGFDDALPHVQKVKEMSFFDETIMLFSTFTTPKFLSYFKKENVFLFQGTSEFKQDFGSFGSSNIGSLTYGLLLQLGAKELYLLGLDFALDQKTGLSHTSAHNYAKNLDISKTNYAVEDELTYNNSVIETEGNFQEKVKTSLILNGFKSQFNLFSKLFKTEDTFVYNLADGAKLDGTIPLHINDLEKKLIRLNKKEIFNIIKRLFDKNSEKDFSKKDINAIQDKIDYIIQLENIVEKYKKQKYSSMDKFHYHMLGLFQELLSEDSNTTTQDLDDLISMYLQYISGYIFDIINTKELDNEKHHIKKLNKIILQQFTKLLSFYRTFLINTLKKIEEEKERG